MEFIITDYYVNQAIEIVNSNGGCPKGTTCTDCIYRKATGSARGCNPENAIKIASTIIDKFNNVK